MEAWRKVWRDGFVPEISTRGLKALKAALETDDQRLLQGATVSPPPLETVWDWPVEAACAISFCGWQGDDRDTVGSVEGFFSNLCRWADGRVGRGNSHHFLAWYDDSPRDIMRRDLLMEVDRAIAERSNIR